MQHDSPTTPASPMVLAVLFGLFAFAPFCYGLVAVMMDWGENQPPTDLPVNPAVGAASITIGFLILSRVLRMLVRLPDHSSAPRFLKAVQTRMIVQLSCIEAIALSSLVVHFLGFFSLALTLILCAVSIASMVTLIPGLMDQVKIYQQLLAGGSENRNEHRLGGG